MYDVLFKDDLSKEDIKKLKNVAKDLLGKIKSMLRTMDHPFDKQETKASIVVTIRDMLWQELPESYPDESIVQLHQPEIWRNGIVRKTFKRHSNGI